MNPRILAVVATAVTAVVLLCTGGTAAIFTGGATANCTPPDTTAIGQPSGSPPAPAPHTTSCHTTISPDGWTQPVPARVISGFRTPDRPGHDGVDLAAPRGTVIRAAATGTVTVARCNATLHDQAYPCDIDGSPTVKGCGWYIDITRPGRIITRYCHMLRRPTVTTGQHITAGQPIGIVGTSGSSSGPHLHFEVHLRGDRSAAGAVNPQAFMAAKGVPLREAS